MRISAGLIVLAACGTPVRTTPPRDRISAPLVDAAVDAAPVPPNALVGFDRRRRMIEAPHGGTITQVAVTEEASAAVSVDDQGGVRLWPALDGTLEPRIVDLPAPRAIAIAADRRGFVLAAIDAAGGLVLQVVDRDGLTVQRASLAADPAFDRVELTGAGALALRTDESLVLVADDGTITSQLVAEPRQRIAGIAVTGTRAVAVVEAGDPALRRARWITLGPQLAWGAWIPGSEGVAPMVALSPSGKRLATLMGMRQGPSPNLHILETQTGADVATLPAGTEWSFAFIDDDHLATASPNVSTIAWTDLTKATAAKRPGNDSDLVPAKLLGAGAGRVVGATSGELMIATPTTLQFLGYDVPTPSLVAAGGESQLRVLMRDDLVALDADLRELPGTALPRTPDTRVASVCRVGQDAWLVGRGSMKTGTLLLELVDAGTGRTRAVRAGRRIIDVLAFEPSTRLVTLSRGDVPEVIRLDPAKQTVTGVLSMQPASSRAPVELVPLAPALASGAQLLVVERDRPLTLRWVTNPAQPSVGTTLKLDGVFAGADHTGRAYVFEKQPEGLGLSAYRDGKRDATFPSTERVFSVWPAPRGEHVARMTALGFGVVSRDGTLKWALPLAGVTEAVWLDDGSLVIVTFAGIARVDPETGALRAARCGWRFGLAKMPHPQPARIEPVCSQVR